VLDDYEYEGSLFADYENSYGRTPFGIVLSSISSSDSVYSAISSSSSIITQTMNRLDYPSNKMDPSSLWPGDIQQMNLGKRSLMNWN